MNELVQTSIYLQQISYTTGVVSTTLQALRQFKVDNPLVFASIIVDN